MGTTAAEQNPSRTPMTGQGWATSHVGPSAGMMGRWTVYDWGSALLPI